MFAIHRFAKRTLTSLLLATPVAVSLAVGFFGGPSGRVTTIPMTPITPTTPTTRASLAVAGGGTTTCPTAGTGAAKPLALVVGASISAGVGATGPRSAWPYLLAAEMGWRVDVHAVSGVGYVRKGLKGAGPLIQELRMPGALVRHPSVVILQAGHDDAKEPPKALESAVANTIRLVNHKAPGAILILVTVFPGGVATPAEQSTNSIIISTARRVDVHAIVINPIAQRWHYRTIKDHLHPTDAGDRWIAGRIARDLAANGITSSQSCVSRTKSGAVKPSQTAKTTGSGVDNA